MKPEEIGVKKKIGFAFLKLFEAFLSWRLGKYIFRSYRDTKTNIQPYGFSPIIVIGMHRSGTTLLARLLSEAGVNMGAYCNIPTKESVFFQQINRKVFEEINIQWDNVNEFSNLENDEKGQNALVIAIHRVLKSSLIYFHSGFKQIFFSKNKPQSVWGWKDPRNTFTISLWLELFPNAKVVYIKRNGIAVAESLVERNSKRVGKSGFSRRCLSFEGAFSLWEEYTDHCEQLAVRMNKKQMVVLKYEELAQHPERVMGQVLKHLGIDYTYTAKDPVFSSIDPSRATAFSNQKNLSEDKRNKMTNPLMIRLGYSNGFENGKSISQKAHNSD